MMVVDSSALLAILFREAEETRFFDVLASIETCYVSAVNAHECLTVLRSRRGPQAIQTFWGLIADLDIGIVPFDESQVRAALAAFDRFGKGIHPRARLNICDCAAYALARTRECPLLFKGDDFAHTDIVPAV